MCVRVHLDVSPPGGRRCGTAGCNRGRAGQEAEHSHDTHRASSFMHSERASCLLRAARTCAPVLLAVRSFFCAASAATAAIRCCYLSLLHIATPLHRRACELPAPLAARTHRDRWLIAPPPSPMQDDLGHAELGYHRPAGYKEVQTPIIDGLVKVGVNLDRFCETGPPPWPSRTLTVPLTDSRTA